MPPLFHPFFFCKMVPRPLRTAFFSKFRPIFFEKTAIFSEFERKKGKFWSFFSQF